jgi:glycosyltransferase involved in cell wall biosynthesis
MACVAVSDAVVDSVQPHFPTLSFVTIPNGVDTTFFSPSAEPLYAVAGKRTIVFVGRFDPRNGVRHMIGAFTVLRRRRDDVQLVVVGDGPLRPLVERMVPADLRDDVVFGVASTASGRGIWRAQRSSARPAASPRSGWSSWRA